MSDFLKSVFGSFSSKQQSADADKKTDTSQQSNNNSNLDKPKSVWDSESENSNQQQQPPAQQTQQQQAVDPQQALRKHLDSLNLLQDVDFAKIQEDIRNGNGTEALQAAMQTMAENGYRASMTQMSNLVDAKVAAMKEQAVNESSATINKNLAITEMNRQLPFTNDPDLAPVAKAVLNQFLQKNSSLEDAIKGTSDFFKAAAKKVSGVDPSSRNAPGEGGFNKNFTESQNQNSNKQTSPSTHDEWIGILAQGQQE